MQANKYIYYGFIYYNGDNINIYLLGLIREGSLLLEEGYRNTYIIAYTILIGIREGGSRLKMISTSI